jgi:sulfur carrier protein
MMIQIKLNGEAHSVSPDRNLQNLIDDLQLGSQSLAIAVNRKVISKSKWNEYVLVPGDQVEIVRAIGGG